jgi:small basic protein
MWTVLWTALALGVMAGIFAVCVAMVVIGIRLYENAVARRRERRPA